LCLSELSDLGPELRAFYEQGRSLKEISAATGIPYSTVRDQLVALGVTFRTNKSVSSSEVLRQHFKNSTPPPYGYYYLDGRLQKDPREFPVLTIIQSLSQRGKNPTEIAQHLNKLKKPTRTGKAWKQPTVYYIVQRLKTEAETASRE
jgi:hypothetical protein